MSDIGRWRNPKSISAAQFEVVAAAAADDDVHFEIGLHDGHPLHFWQQDHILVTDDVDEKEDQDLVRLGAVVAPDAGNGRQTPRRDSVKLLRLDKLGKARADQRTRAVVEELSSTKALRDKVFVNNLVYVTHGDGANICPAAEPVPRRKHPYTNPYPPKSAGNGGAGVRVAVIDTGIPRGMAAAHPWLFGDQMLAENDDTIEQATYDNDGFIAPHAGHGAFIAGIIRCVAPQAQVRVLNSLRWSGSMTESGVAQAIEDLLDDDPPDIISFSAGYMVHEGGDPSALRRVLRRLEREHPRTVLVAATGNDGHGPEDHGLFYPAAFAKECTHYVDDGLLVAVGALREDREGRACFSNFGDWVTVYEEGENLVNVFPEGEYVYREPLSDTVPPQCIYYPDQPIHHGCTCVSAPAQHSRAKFTGMAAWSGTSFATPIVVGRIARRMTEPGSPEPDPRAAVRHLLKDITTITDAGDGEQLKVFADPVVS